MDLKKIFRYAGYGFIWGLVSQIFLLVVFLGLGVMKESEDNLLEPMVIPTALNFLIIGMIVPVLEEILFRGPLRLLLFWKKRPPWVVYSLLILTALLFGYAHIFNYTHPYTQTALAYGLTKVVVGVVFGWVVIKSNSLLASILAHGANNSILIGASLLISFFQKSFSF